MEVLVLRPSTGRIELSMAVESLVVCTPSFAYVLEKLFLSISGVFFHDTKCKIDLEFVFEKYVVIPHVFKSCLQKTQIELGLELFSCYER